ncbi:hypothetical protein [Gluconobacter kondonii]|uniref:hypothetical protein n=1 Tax=Gluconobacter kondonii TaxID=941463 RepID=UPI0038CF3BEB
MLIISGFPQSFRPFRALPIPAIPTHCPKDHFTTEITTLEIIHNNRSKPKAKAKAKAKAKVASGKDTNFATEPSILHPSSRHAFKGLHKEQL